MSIETEDELEGLRRAGRVFARHGDLVKLDVTAELDGFYADACVSVPVAPALAAHTEHSIVVTDGRPLVLTA